MKTFVVAKCIGCGFKREIKAGEVPEYNIPMCSKCYMPMVAEKGIVKIEKEQPPQIENEGALPLK